MKVTNMIKLGMKVRDSVSGLEGIVVALTTWLNGCVRVTIQQRIGKDGKMPETVTVDEPQLIVVGKSKHKQNLDGGGPIPEPKQHRGPGR